MKPVCSGGLLALVLLWSAASWAANLSNSQYTILQNDITVTNQAEFAEAVANNDDQVIANAYNQLATPAYWVWKTRLTRPDIYDVTSVDSTTWDWTQFIAQSQAEQGAWQEMFAGINAINPSLANVRGAYAKVFSGAGTGPTAQRAHLNAVSRRIPTRGERLFAIATPGGVGTRGSTSNPDTMTFEGAIRLIDVAHALRNVPLP